jgi:hypothetical protein
MPRPPVLDDVRRAEVLALATYGFSRRAIANYVGCAPNTIANTAARDPDFALQLRRSTQHFVCRNIENVQRHAMQSPKNSLWLLERLQPDQFARRSPHSITPAQLNRKFQSWIKALVAAAPPDAQTAVAQAASELAAQHLSNLDDDPPDTDDQADDLPSDAQPAAAQPSAGHSNPAVATPVATKPRATGVPPVPRDGATSAPPVPSGPAAPAPTSPTAVQLPTPTSALPASSPLPASASAFRAPATAAMLLLSLLFLGGSAIAAVSSGLQSGRAGSSHFAPASHGQSSDDRDDAGAQPPAPSPPKAGTDATASHASARVVIAQNPPDVTPSLVKNPRRPADPVSRTRQRRNVNATALSYKPPSATRQSDGSPTAPTNG